MNKLTPEEFWFVDAVPEPVEDRGGGRTYPLQIARVAYERERLRLEATVGAAERKFVQEHNERISMAGDHYRRIPPTLSRRIGEWWKRQRWHSAELAWSLFGRRNER